MIDITMTEARRHFGRMLKTVQTEPAQILKRGKVAAFVVSAEEYQEFVAAGLAADSAGAEAIKKESRSG